MKKLQQEHEYSSFIAEMGAENYSKIIAKSGI